MPLECSKLDSILGKIDAAEKVDAVLNKIDSWDPPRRSGLWGGKNESKLKSEGDLGSRMATAVREKEKRTGEPHQYEASRRSTKK